MATTKIKIKKGLGLTQYKKNLEKKITLKWKREIADLIIDKITQGISPVQGHGRFEPYSDSYAKKKGRKQPVDMVVTGKMLESIVVNIVSNNRLSIYFRSRIAKYHNEDGRVIRRLLPNQKGETFKSDIMARLKKLVKEAIKETKK